MQYALLILSCGCPKSTNWRSLMDLTTILIVILVIALLGGGGFYGRGRWW